MSVDDAVFYVYTHTFANGTRYVGKGKGLRAYAQRRHNRHWVSLCNKYGPPEVAIIAEHMPEELAFLVERELIDLYRKIAIPLCNYTDGGEGVSGYTYTSEQLAAMSKRRTEYMNRPEVKRKYAESTRAHMSKPEVKAYMLQQLAVRMTSDEYRAKLSERAKEVANRPEIKALRSALFKRLWADEATRERMASASRDYWATPEAREKQARVQRDRMTKPEVRAQYSAIRRKRIAESGPVYINPDKFEFFHQDKGTFIGTRQEFLKANKNVTATKLSAIIHGRRTQTNGWKLLRKVCE